jgi:hypothetical protein
MCNVAIMLLFEGSSLYSIRLQEIELRAVNRCVCVLFSDVGVLTYDAGAPSGGQRSSCRNSPNYSKMDLQLPSKFAICYLITVAVN